MSNPRVAPQPRHTLHDAHLSTRQLALKAPPRVFLIIPPLPFVQPISLMPTISSCLCPCSLVKTRLVPIPTALEHFICLSLDSPASSARHCIAIASSRCSSTFHPLRPPACAPSICSSPPVHRARLASQLADPLNRNLPQAGSNTILNRTQKLLQSHRHRLLRSDSDHPSNALNIDPGDRSPLQKVT